MRLLCQDLPPQRKRNRTEQTTMSRRPQAEVEHNCSKHTATSRSACYNTLRKGPGSERTVMRMWIKKYFFTDGGGRSSLKTAHSDVPFSILRHAELDQESDKSELGHDFLCGGDIEGALSSDSDPALHAQSNDEKRNFRVSKSGRRLPSVNTRHTCH